MLIQTFPFKVPFNTLLCQQDNNSQLQGDVDRLLEDGSLDENVEFFYRKMTWILEKQWDAAWILVKVRYCFPLMPCSS